MQGILTEGFKLKIYFWKVSLFSLRKRSIFFAVHARNFQCNLNLLFGKFHQWIGGWNLTRFHKKKKNKDAEVVARKYLSKRTP